MISPSLWMPINVQPYFARKSKSVRLLLLTFFDAKSSTILWLLESSM